MFAIPRQNELESRVPVEEVGRDHAYLSACCRYSYPATGQPASTLATVDVGLVCWLAVTGGVS